jgi:hypothetical protein
MDQCNFKPMQQSDLQQLGGPNPDNYLLSRLFFRVLLYPSGPIAAAGTQLSLFLVEFTYSIANCKIWLFVYHCSVVMYLLR